MLQSHELHKATGKLIVSTPQPDREVSCAGAVEAIFTILSLFHSQAPPTLNLMQPDPALLGQALVANEVRGLRKDALSAMSNSFGFGGTNASLLFTVPPGVE